MRAGGTQTSAVNTNGSRENDATSRFYRGNTTCGSGRYGRTKHAIQLGEAAAHAILRRISAGAQARCKAREHRHRLTTHRLVQIRTA